MNDIYQYERSELAQVRAQLLHLFFIVGIFSFLVNLLLLTGPLYMLHIYDRVLPSGAVQTLVALSLMACTEDLEVQTQQYLNRAMLIRALGMQSTTLTRQHRLQHAAQIAQLFGR